MPPPSPHPHPPLLSPPLLSPPIPGCPQSDLDVTPRRLADQSSGDFQRCGVWCAAVFSPRHRRVLKQPCIICTGIDVYNGGGHVAGATHFKRALCLGEMMKSFLHLGGGAVIIATLTQVKALPDRVQLEDVYASVFPLCLFQIPIGGSDHRRFFPPRSKTLKPFFTRPLKELLLNSHFQTGRSENRLADPEFAPMI